MCVCVVYCVIVASKKEENTVHIRRKAERKTQFSVYVIVATIRLYSSDGISVIVVCCVLRLYSHIGIAIAHDACVAIFFHLLAVVVVVVIFSYGRVLLL